MVGLACQPAGPLTNASLMLPRLAFLAAPQVGLLAPWLLVLTRVVQGFAVGGEFTATIVFLVEHAPPGQAGLQGSWAFFSVMLGVLAGSLVSMLFNYALSDAQLYAWGWRVPFLLSILGAGVGAYMRRTVHEPCMFLNNEPCLPIRGLVCHVKAQGNQELRGA